MADIDPKNIQESLKHTAELQSLLLEMTDIYHLTNKELNIHSLSWREITKQSTVLNSLLNQSLTIQAKIGTEIVKRKTVTDQINRLEAFANVIREKASVLQASLTESQKKQYQDLLSQKQREKELEELIAFMSDKSFYSEKAKSDVKRELINLQERINDSINTEASTALRALNLLSEQERIAREVSGNLKEQEKLLDKANSKVKFFNEKLKLSSELSSTIGTKWRYMINSFISGSGLVGLVILFKEMVMATLKMDEHTTNIANNLSVSKEAGKAILDSFAGVSMNTQLQSKLLDKSLLSISNQVEALHQLQDSYGASVLLTQKSLQGQIFLTKQLKLSSEEAGNIQKLAILNNIQSDKAVMITSKQIALFEKESGIRFNSRKIIQQISKINGEILAQYKNQPELLAKAVLEANKLGISLEKSRDMANSLLDFESSIENELEAEVLLGRGLNLEKARSLALDGDSVGAGKELLRQAGSLNELTKLNVIQRKSLAQSFGMSSDELIESVRQAELLKRASFENTEALKEQYEYHRRNGTLSEFEADMRLKTGDDMLSKQAAQLSLQERFKESLEKVKELFIFVASGPLQSLVSGITKLINNAWILKAAVYAIGAGLAFAAARAITMAIASAFTSAAAVPIIGLGLGLAAGGAAAAYLSKVNSDINPKKVQDGVISPDGGMMISTSKGMIQTHRDDHLIATPDPKGILGGRNVNIDTKRLEDKLDVMISLLQKGGNVFMDSKKVGTTQGMAYSGFA